MVNHQRTIDLSLAQQSGWLNDRGLGHSVGESFKLPAEAARLAYGVPESLGGVDGTLVDVIEEISCISEQCLTSGFVFWCQRAFIECLIASSNCWLQQQILPSILRAECSGATELFNALQVKAFLEAETVVLEGFLPWISNLQPENFVVAIAAQATTGETLVIAVPSSADGLERGEDLQLLGLQASWTSTLRLNQVRLPRQWIISEDGSSFVAKIRPALVFMQSGLALGIARRSLQETLQSLDALGEEALMNRLKYNCLTLAQLENQVRSLNALPAFDTSHTHQSSELRIALTRLALDSVWLELEAKGKIAYLEASETARRLREVSFLPVLTPSLLELEHELNSFAQISHNAIKKA